MDLCTLHNCCVSCSSDYLKFHVVVFLFHSFIGLTVALVYSFSCQSFIEALLELQSSNPLFRQLGLGYEQKLRSGITLGLAALVDMMHFNQVLYPCTVYATVQCTLDTVWAFKNVVYILSIFKLNGDIEHLNSLVEFKKTGI